MIIEVLNKKVISEFIDQTLKMELSKEKTLITHSSEYARFLGYDVCVRRCGKVKPVGAGRAKKRTLNNKTELLVPLKDNIHKFIFSKGIAVQKDDGTLFPTH